MKDSIQQKELKLAEQFKSRTAPAIPEDWQKNLMAAVRTEKASGRTPAIFEDERFIFRFAIAPPNLAPGF